MKEGKGSIVEPASSSVFLAQHAELRTTCTKLDLAGLLTT